MVVRVCVLAPFPYKFSTYRVCKMFSHCVHVWLWLSFKLQSNLSCNINNYMCDLMQYLDKSEDVLRMILATILQTFSMISVNSNN